jgi:hypothetical protein
MVLKINILLILEIVAKFNLRSVFYFCAFEVMKGVWEFLDGVKMILLMQAHE